MNIVESVVGCFVGLWCLFATRCEGVLVSGVYREFCVLFGLPRYISFIHNICINLCCCLIILIYTGYPLSHPFSICISITSINWLTYMYSHFLVLMLPYTGPNTKVRSRWDNTFTSCHLWREPGIWSEGCFFCSNFNYVIAIQCEVIFCWVKWCLSDLY